MDMLCIFIRNGTYITVMDSLIHHIYSIFNISATFSLYVVSTFIHVVSSARSVECFFCIFSVYVTSAKAMMFPVMFLHWLVNLSVTRNTQIVMDEIVIRMDKPRDKDQLIRL